MSFSLAEIDGLLLDLLHLSLDIVFLPVVTHDTLERVSVLNPLNQSSVAAQRHNRVSS